MNNECQCSYCRRSNPDRTNDRLLPEPKAQEFLGGVSHMWIRRRLRDSRFVFPKRIELGRRRFFYQSDLAAWIESPHAALRTEPNFTEAAA